MQTAYVVEAIRTPIGKYGGSLAHCRPDDLLAHVIRGVLQKHPELDLNDIEDVIAGDANQAGEDNRNVARMAALLSGLPVSVAGNTVNRLCASGLQAIMDASRAIMTGDGGIFIAGGVESMTRAPFVMLKPASSWTRQSEMADTTIGWRFPNKNLIDKYYPYSMGETAENVARQWKISRQEQDEFAMRSHEKYFAAHQAGRFKEEISPVEVNGGNVWFDTDEHPRRTDPTPRPARRDGHRSGSRH